MQQGSVRLQRTQQSSGSTFTQSGNQRKPPKRGCWTCGEKHFQRDCPHESREDLVRNQEHSQTTFSDSSKSHKIHVVVENQ
jgi:hypothetical protein